MKLIALISLLILVSTSVYARTVQWSVANPDACWANCSAEAAASGSGGSCVHDRGSCTFTQRQGFTGLVKEDKPTIPAPKSLKSPVRRR